MRMILLFILLIPQVVLAHTLNTAIIAIEETAPLHYAVGIHYSPAPKDEPLLEWPTQCESISHLRTENAGINLHKRINIQCDTPLSAHPFTLLQVLDNKFQWFLKFQGDGIKVEQSLYQPELDFSAAHQGQSPSPSLLESLMLGIEHILLGWDHLLLLLAFLLFCRTSRSLVLTLSGFTLGHATTIFLTAFGVIQLPTLFVESMIALSIILLAKDIYNGRDSSNTAYVFLFSLSFGLFHGLGFARFFSTIYSDFWETLVNLIAFNLGIELGQLIFIAVSLILFSKLYKKPGFRKPAAYSIGVLGSYFFWNALSIT